jgi:hypothetical protein
VLYPDTYWAPCAGRPPVSAQLPWMCSQMLRDGSDLRYLSEPEFQAAREELLRRLAPHAAAGVGGLAVSHRPPRLMSERAIPCFNDCNESVHFDCPA